APLWRAYGDDLLQLAGMDRRDVAQQRLARIASVRRERLARALQLVAFDWQVERHVHRDFAEEVTVVDKRTGEFGSAVFGGRRECLVDTGIRRPTAGIEHLQLEIS